MVKASRTVEDGDGTPVAFESRAPDFLQQPALAHAGLSFNQDTSAFCSFYKALDTLIYL